jgi:hypothetical protein
MNVNESGLQGRHPPELVSKAPRVGRVRFGMGQLSGRDVQLVTCVS